MYTESQHQWKKTVRSENARNVKLIANGKFSIYSQPWQPKNTPNTATAPWFIRMTSGLWYAIKLKKVRKLLLLHCVCLICYICYLSEDKEEDGLKISRNRLDWRLMRLYELLKTETNVLPPPPFWRTTAICYTYATDCHLKRVVKTGPVFHVLCQRCIMHINAARMKY